MPKKSRGSGKVSRRVALALIGGGGLIGLSGTGAFDMVSADRGFEISTADDDSAKLGLVTKQTSGFDGSTINLIELTNRFGEDLDSVSAEIDGYSGPISSLSAPDSLANGDSGHITADLSCGNGATVKIQIEASSENKEIELTRSVYVSCTGVCGKRTIPAGCVDNSVPPNGQTTACSVEINKQNQYTKTISNATIEGALDVANTGNQVNITLIGTIIKNYVKINTSAQIGFDLGDTAEVQNGVKFITDSQIDPNIDGKIEGGICIESGEVNNLSSNGGDVTGPISIDSTDQIKINRLKNSSIEKLDLSSGGQVQIKAQASTIDGDIDIDSPSGQVKILRNFKNSTITGDITVTSDSQITIKPKETTINGDIDATSDSQITIKPKETTINGDIDATSDSQITIDPKKTTINGDVNITSDSQVKIRPGNNATITGDVTIDTPGGVQINCSNIEGEITVNGGSTNPC